MFTMDIGSHEYREHVIVTMSGELDLAYAADVAAGLRMITRRSPRIIADLADLEFIDCRGAAALVSGRWHARLACGDLLLAAPPPRVRRVLAVNRPTSTFPVHASVEAAAARAGSPRGTAPGRTG